MPIKVRTTLNAPLPAGPTRKSHSPLKLCSLLILLGLGALCLSPAHAEIYKWKDSNGNVHFADKKPLNANSEKVEVRGGSVSSATSETSEAPAETQKSTKKPAPPPTKQGTANSNNQKKAVRYSKLEITSPENDQPLRANNGEVKLLCNIQPRLQSSHSHKIRFYIDGQPLEQLSTACSVVFRDVERGTHSTYVEIIDDKKKTLIRSETHQFHVQRFSKL